MNKPILTEHGHKIIFNKESHVYVKDNEYIVGMSTLLGKLASPALERWKIATRTNNIKQQMEKENIPPDVIEKIIINAKAEEKKSSDTTLSIGSVVHELAERWLKGLKITKPENPIVANCFMEFQKFWKKYKLKVLETEKILYSERGYCGTLDIIATDPDGNIWLIDIKTSTGLFLNMVHQVHGYKLAYEEQTGKKVNKMYIVRLPKTNESFEARQILYKKDHMKAFLGLLYCHKSELLFNEQMRKLKTLTKRSKNV